MGASKHILLPAKFGGDGDKAVCGVRLSANPDRRAFKHPSEMTGDGCETCYLKTLRSWQGKQADINPIPSTWSSWPWEAP
jgi:hypothetical protein